MIINLSPSNDLHVYLTPRPALKVRDPYRALQEDIKRLFVWVSTLAFSLHCRYARGIGNANCLSFWTYTFNENSLPLPLRLEIKENDVAK